MVAAVLRLYGLGEARRLEVRHGGLAPHRSIKHQAQMAQLGASHLAMAVQVKLNVG